MKESNKGLRKVTEALRRDIEDLKRDVEKAGQKDSRACSRTDEGAQVAKVLGGRFLSVPADLRALISEKRVRLINLSALWESVHAHVPLLVRSDHEKGTETETEGGGSQKRADSVLGGTEGAIYEALTDPKCFVHDGGGVGEECQTRGEETQLSRVLVSRDTLRQSLYIVEGPLDGEGDGGDENETEGVRSLLTLVSRLGAQMARLSKQSANRDTPLAYVPTTCLPGDPPVTDGSANLGGFPLFVFWAPVCVLTDNSATAMQGERGQREGGVVNQVQRMSRCGPVKIQDVSIPTRGYLQREVEQIWREEKQKRFKAAESLHSRGEAGRIHECIGGRPLHMPLPEEVDNDLSSFKGLRELALSGAVSFLDVRALLCETADRLGVPEGGSIREEMRRRGGCLQECVPSSFPIPGQKHCRKSPVLSRRQALPPSLFLSKEDFEDLECTPPHIATDSRGSQMGIESSSSSCSSTPSNCQSDKTQNRPATALEIFVGSPIVLFALSYGWLTRDLPDDERGFHLSRVVGFFEKLLVEDQRFKGKKVGLFWDFASVHQFPRSVAEAALFKAVIANMNIIYSHRFVCVLRSRGVPENSENPTPFEFRGWPFFEVCVSSTKSSQLIVNLPQQSLVNVSEHTENADFGVGASDIDEWDMSAEWLDTIPSFSEASTGAVSVPLGPREFGRLVGFKKFTSGSDCDTVRASYGRFFKAVAAEIEQLSFTDRPALGDEHARSLASFIRDLHSPWADGALHPEALSSLKLREIRLEGLSLGDEGLIALCHGLESLSLARRGLSAAQPVPPSLFVNRCAHVGAVGLGAAVRTHICGAVNLQIKGEEVRERKPLPSLSMPLDALSLKRLTTLPGEVSDSVSRLKVIIRARAPKGVPELLKEMESALQTLCKILCRESTHAGVCTLVSELTSVEFQVAPVFLPSSFLLSAQSPTPNAEEEHLLLSSLRTFCARLADKIQGHPNANIMQKSRLTPSFFLHTSPNPPELLMPRPSVPRTLVLRHINNRSCFKFRNFMRDTGRQIPGCLHGLLSLEIDEQSSWIKVAGLRALCEALAPKGGGGAIELEKLDLGGCEGLNDDAEEVLLQFLRRLYAAKRSAGVSFSPVEIPPRWKAMSREARRRVAREAVRLQTSDSSKLPLKLHGFGYASDEVVRRWADDLKALNGEKGGLRGVKIINLCGCRLITTEGLRALCQALAPGDGEGAIDLEEVDLGGCEGLSDESAELLVEFLERLHAAKRSAGGNCGPRVLSRVFPLSAIPSTLNASEVATNEILCRWSEDLKTLHKRGAGIRGLKIINLYSCRLITTEGLRALCQALAPGDREGAIDLEEVDLSGCEGLSDESAKVLVEFLERLYAAKRSAGGNCGPVEIYMSETGLSEEATARVDIESMRLQTSIPSKLPSSLTASTRATDEILCGWADDLKTIHRGEGGIRGVKEINLCSSSLITAEGLRALCEALAPESGAGVLDLEKLDLSWCEGLNDESERVLVQFLRRLYAAKRSAGMKFTPVKMRLDVTGMSEEAKVRALLLPLYLIDSVCVRTWCVCKPACS
uniref:Uncharacterized protein n=1 Tax=Chromera velia CCMP2878 TaxID=1169474 RepID=A0A0G4G2T3_9ALVE|eukprot:Cvel_4106.t1-p1 / transcript=Cvel_4106.t1 / gene=Cvel_4106 / organism=Chromera_velia_CCMP2878 / gene_product=hypothetical protein / transcript_product=hypothetical protein / location=Cvel_scaffold175:24041-30183(-) / protein_length=1548 / sequence_SO=supercontig / SO=protein_coding / is_pseudo=false